MDKELISKGDYTVREGRKEQRKLKTRSQVAQDDAFQKRAGVHYQPQEFHVNSKN